MEPYLNLVRHILDNGEDSGDRTGTGTRRIFGHQMRFDLAKGFPLVSVKRTFWRGAFTEMLWFLRGESDAGWLQDHGVHIWDEWADENGDLGPVYGHQWRSWGAHPEIPFGGVDQITDLIAGLEQRPQSRRHILSAWNAEDLPDENLSPQENVANGKMALAPCHMTVQFFVSRSGRLSAQVYQRSADVFLGVPFNIAGYALLIHLISHHLGMQPGELIWTGGDCHLYSNHAEQAREMLARKPVTATTPQLVIQCPPQTPLMKIQPSDCAIFGYHPHAPIKAPVAV